MLGALREGLAQLRLRRHLARAGVGHALKVPTYTRVDELSVLYHLARSLPDHANALEIGSFLGASACFIGAGLADRGGRLFCVDTWKNENMPDEPEDTLPIFVRNTGALGKTVVPIRKESRQLTSDDLVTPLHLVFIDGDHEYAAVREDVTRVQDWLAPSALIAMHDSTAWQGVSRVIGEMLADGRFMLAGHHRNLTWLRPAQWPER